MTIEIELPFTESSRAISVADIHRALDLVVYQGGPATVEQLEPLCGWDVCSKTGDTFCLFPRYTRDGVAVGLTAKILIQLGYPHQLLLDLDREHELGDILHPGVKIVRSVNAALRRIDPTGIALLAFIQEQQKAGRSWGSITVKAFGPTARPRILDRRRRPWLY